MSLQPLVENAIKHAVAKSTEPVNIDVRISRDANLVTIVVADDGPGLGAPSDLGIGLSNVRDRLAYLFADNARLDVGNNADGGVTARLVFPEQTPGPQAVMPNRPEQTSAPDIRHTVAPI
jgi:sensor histidine kinase YesM